MLDNLLDAATQHLLFADFYAPPKERLDQLQSGDFVKICRNRERFWVQVSETFGETITGTVDNILIDDDNRDLPLGTPVVFERRHAYDAILRHAGETTGETV